MNFTHFILTHTILNSGVGTKTRSVPDDYWKLMSRFTIV